GERYVLAAGSRAVVPPIEGLEAVRHHTSDTVMRIDELPRRALIVGGGFIAAEFGHIFASLGTEVTQVVRGEKLLRHHDDDISECFTDVVSERYDLRLASTVTSVRRAPASGRGTGAPGGADTPGATTADADAGNDSSGAQGPILATIVGPNGEDTVETDLLLLATGRTPNGDAL